MSESAYLVVQRQSGRDLKLRQIIVIIDGKVEAKLYFNDVVTIPVEPGERKVRFDNTWAKKDVTLEFRPGQTRTFAVANIPAGCLLLGVALASAAPMGLVIEEVDPA